MNSKKRLSISLTALIALCLGLCVTSFALGYTFLRVEDNFFHTGETLESERIEIDIEDVVKRKFNLYYGN